MKLTIWQGSSVPPSLLRLTSPEALAALHNLPTTNHVLYCELSGAPTTDYEGDDIEDAEPVFSDIVDNDSDIPVDVVLDHVLSGGCDIKDGFAVALSGEISQLGSSKDADAEDDVTELTKVSVVKSLGCGHQRKTAPKRLGNIGAWEAH
jgi:hypothetical protein